MRRTLKTSAALSSLSALANESRLAIFRLLVQAGPAGLAASKIAQRMDMPASSLSFHLKEMAHANLISATQQGRSIIYAAEFDTMNNLLRYLTDNCCGGNPCSPVTSISASKTR
jgi:ArsR family transcriptional regulator